jgi:hypothetical protein
VPDKEQDAVDDLKRRLAEVARGTRQEVHIDVEPTEELPPQPPRAKATDTSKRETVTKRRRIPCVNVWLSDHHKEVVRYIEVDDSISAGPRALIMRLKKRVFTVEGQGMMRLAEELGCETVAELIHASRDTIREWAIERILMHSPEKEFFITDKGELVIQDAPVAVDA